jgi:outer membrane protein
MKLWIKTITVFAFVAMLVPVLQAQKLGYINSSELLNEHPEIKAANAELETLQKQLAAKMQQKVEVLQAKYEDLARKENQGEISPRELQEQANVLRQEEATLQQEEQGMQNQLLQKREELYSPILEKVEIAIQEVARENGFTYVFDASAGFLLYADETQDISELVRTKLGL